MEHNFFEEEKNLTTSETTIMKVIWEEEADISTLDLTEKLRTKYGKEYARTTVATFLVRLAAKGFVKTYRKGKSAYVHATKKEEEYKTKLLSDETDFWFRGSISSMISALCRDRNLTQKDIQEIRSILDDITISGD